MRKAASGTSNARAAAAGASSARPPALLKRTTSARSHNQSALSNLWELPPVLASKVPGRVQSVVSMKMPTNPTLVSKQTASIGPKSAGSVLRQRRAAAKAASASATQIIKVDDSSSQDPECIVLEPILPAQKKPRNTPQSASSSLRRAVATPKPTSIVISVGIDDSDDDFVKPPSKRKPSKHSNIISDSSSDAQPVNHAIKAMKTATTPTAHLRRLARKPSVEEVCLPSSPPLLRHGSPTIERHNSQTQNMPILDTTSSATSNAMPLPRFSSAADMFSQETLVPSFSRANTATGHMSRAVSASTTAAHHLELVASKASTPQFRRNLSATKEALKGVDAELLDDPIDEFLTQDAGVPALRPSTLASDPYSSEDMAGSRPDRSSPVHPGISQWYRDNHDRFIGVGEDSDGAEMFAGDRLSDGLDRHIHSRASLSDQEHAPQGYVSIDSSDDEAPQSPLEGFCDLREFAGTGDGSMDIYLNQFAPAVRRSPQQRGGRGRRRRDSSSSPSQPAASGSHERPTGGRATRGGRRGRGQQTAAGFGRIRPVTSARSSRTATVATSAPIIYNHYADDGYLDIAPSMNWEGSGMSRFG